MIAFKHITKRFGGVLALDDVSVEIARGECHALCGENGAGKSTLGKCLAGIHRPDAGEIVLDGAARRFSSPADAARAGIGMVHQELAFCPDLSIAENLALGRYPRRAGLFVRWSALRKDAEARLAQIGVALDVRRPMRSLSTAQEQQVQIAAAVAAGARVLVFDEPTSSLSESEVHRLFTLIDQLKAQGVTIIYVSHRLAEVFRLTERISILRDGRHVSTVNTRDTNERELVRLMIGRTLVAHTPSHIGRPPGAPLLEVRGLTSPGRFRDVTFEARAGEIVGFAGLVGAGRSEVAQAIFGLDRAARGHLKIAGRAVPLGRPAAVLRSGLGLVPEDRKRQGLVLMLSGRHNFSLAALDLYSRLGWVLRGRERQDAVGLFGRMAVKTPSIETPVRNLSGGNQQKVVIAKWLARRLSVLIVDEPTRGVDVGAKGAIHALLDELAARGVAVVLISSDMPELVALSSRVIVMREGRVVGEWSRDAATPDTLLKAMAGVAG